MSSEKPNATAGNAAKKPKWTVGELLVVLALTGTTEVALENTGGPLGGPTAVLAALEAIKRAGAKDPTANIDQPIPPAVIEQLREDPEKTQESIKRLRENINRIEGAIKRDKGTPKWELRVEAEESAIPSARKP